MFERHLARVDAMRDQLLLPEFSLGIEWFNSAPLTVKSDLSGKIVIIYFWNENCLEDMASLSDLQNKYGTHPVVFIGMNSEEFLDTEKLPPFPGIIVHDKDKHLWNKIGARSCPIIMIIGPYGNTLLSLFGFEKKTQLDSFLQTALKYYAL